ncbi:MAG: hypothetical protein E7401_03395 [Ruminococcaceae bacterium]|nr:hypothetical protein [Oscillospiraceae bacterium]
MTRDDLRGIIEGITDEQLKRILDIHSQGVGKAKGEVEGLKLQLSEAEAKLAGYKETVKSLENSQCEAEKMKIKIEELQKVIDQSEAAKSREALEKRFDNAAGDAKFLNDFTKSGLMAEFLEAVQDEKNAGRSDGEIFGGLVDGREDIFAPDEGVPTVIASTMGFGGQITENDVREIMGLAPQN